MPESPASEPLHMLQSELNGAKTQWEYLEDRITNGYKDAYKLHLGALTEMHKAKLLEEQRDAKWIGIGMFVFSVVSVGFAGGLVGGVIAPWVKKAEVEGANAALRQGIQGIATRTTQQGVLRIVPERPSESSSSNESPYAPVSPEAFDTYLEKKEEMDGCFALVNSDVQKMIDRSNIEQWSYGEGQAVLDGFRRSCRLLTDAPDPTQLPTKELAEKTAELAMWVAWANARDWPWWEKVYKGIDAELQKRERSTAWSVYALWAWELKPILNRLKALHVAGLEQDLGVPFVRPQGLPGGDSILDLRKLRRLRLQHLPDLPFGEMEKLDFRWAQSALRLDGGKFLDGLRDLRPYHITGAGP